MNKNPARITDPVWLKGLLIFLTIAFMSLLFLFPLAEIFIQAFSKGKTFYLQSLSDPVTLQSIKLTLLAALIAVPLNMVFGIVASYAIARFQFLGKSLLVSLIDLPFAVSPVISGLIYVLLFGAQGLLAPALEKTGLRILFAVPGIILATIFVTFPFIAKELIPLMQEQGKDEEEAALMLGASPMQMFFRITLPNIKWGLIYGIILCNARAMGEFGAVSVVSGHIRGETTTIPLHVEILYNEYNSAGAFSVATLLALLALITLFLKSILEIKTHMKKAMPKEQ